ncbi:increased DNA methylation 1-like isoform X2 [Bidens hawaiensis]|uniref:increased DNA methylation 1-like isoform X2 n=1 Tax=Bidens hawaiensis TaxID=980011 RepID=UPI0040499912
MECENKSEVVEGESGVDIGDDMKVVTGGQEECNKVASDGSMVVGENNDDGVMTLRKCSTRGRKKKVLESSDCNGDTNPKTVKVDKDEVKVTGRVLRSRTQAMSGSAKVDESVVGFKRKMEAECFDHSEFQKEVIKSTRGPKKKQKRRGRPPKNEAGLRRKTNDESFDQDENLKEVDERKQPVGRPPKKQKRPGRPFKTKDVCLNQIDLQKESSQLTGKQQKRKHKDTTVEHVQNQDQEFDIAGSGDNNEEAVTDESTKQLNNTLTGEERKKKQQAVREQISGMITKAGWTIEYRPRQGRDYLDAVYVDQKGRTHWSITKAYFSLKKKIENDDADDKEIAAFTPIPDEEMNTLLRIVSKIRSDKNKKKGKKGKNISKAEIVISGDDALCKILNKKRKDGKKRKAVQKSTVKLANKTSNVKVKKDSVVAESAIQRRPKVSQNGRQSRKPCLVARSSNKGVDQDDDDFSLFNGKRNIISWMIDSGVIVVGGKFVYGEGRRRNKLLEGQVTCDGLHCSCCNETMDVSKFVSHGGGKLDQALKSIHYESGASLFTCLLNSWKKETALTDIKFSNVDVKGDDPHDDTCNICGDGGDLICCDGCPSTFHQSCLDIENFPSGDWYCIYCCCKFCGLVACGASHTSEMVKCCLCEEKFHRPCLEEENVADAGSSSLSFCGKKCLELYEQLQTYIGVKFELKEGYSWTLLKCYDLSQDLDDPMKVHCNSKLAVAFSVMDECFVPVMDERSGVNRIHDVVYNCGSNFRRLDYSGFYTAILEKDGELTAAASIRIHGIQLAEMPFIGTRNMYRRQGMCRRLLDAIEGALCSLGVDELVIPAIPELYKTWTEVFGFKPSEELVRQAMKGISLIVFPGTDILHKPLIKNQTLENDYNTLFNEQALATHPEPETLTTSLQTSEFQSVQSNDEHKPAGSVNDDVTGVDMSQLTSEAIPKNSFDLNLQPAATDVDIQSTEDETISREPQVCKTSFELSDPMVQVDNAATQSLVLV